MNFKINLPKKEKLMKTTCNIILAFLISLSLIAQQSEMKERELLVEKEYSNEIYETNPLFDYASILTPTRSAKLTTDSLSKINIFTPDMDIQIRPIAFETSSIPSGPQGFLKLDKGQMNPIHGQAGYVYSSPNYFNLSGLFNYDQRKDNRVEDKTVRMISGKISSDYYITNELKSELELEYVQNEYGLFGHPTLEFPEELISQNQFSTMRGRIGLETFNSAPQKWNFGLHTTLSNWTDANSDSAERNILASGRIIYVMSDKWGIYLAPSYQNSNSDVSGDAEVITSSLRFTYNDKNFYTRAGVKADHFNEDWIIWPDVDLRWNINPETVINLRSVTESLILGNEFVTSVNPYINSQIDKYIRFFRHIDADISSTLANDLNFNIQIGYLKASNDMNFNAQISDIRRFDVTPVDYERLRFVVSVDKELIEGEVKAGMAIRYDNYAQMSSTLLYRPTFAIMPFIEVDVINDKVDFDISALINNPQEMNEIPAANTMSDWRYDLNASLKIYLSDMLNINLNADNILNNSYEVWSGYDNFGRNLSGGILVKF